MPDLLKIGSTPRFAVKTRLATTFKPGNMSLSVKSLKGTTFQVHLPAHSTIADLKNAIRDWEGYTLEQDFRMTCAGKNLSTEHLALAKCNVVLGSDVLVIGRLLGGKTTSQGRTHAGGLGQSFVDMENMSALRIVNVRGRLPEDPEWTIINSGLNIRGTCQNAKCAAHLSTVRCPKGFTAFNIAEGVKCPGCKTSFSAITCGFKYFEWMFEGRKTGVSSIDMMSTWHATGSDKFQWFDEAGGRNITEWSNLIITTKKLASGAGTVSTSLKQVGNERCVLCFELANALTPPASTSCHAT